MFRNSRDNKFNFFFKETIELKDDSNLHSIISVSSSRIHAHIVPLFFQLFKLTSGTFAVVADRTNPLGLFCGDQLVLSSSKKMPLSGEPGPSSFGFSCTFLLFSFLAACSASSSSSRSVQSRFSSVNFARFARLSFWSVSARDNSQAD